MGHVAPLFEPRGPDYSLKMASFKLIISPSWAGYGPNLSYNIGSQPWIREFDKGKALFGFKLRFRGSPMAFIDTRGVRGIISFNLKGPRSKKVKNH